MSGSTHAVQLLCPARLAFGPTLSRAKHTPFLTSWVLEPPSAPGLGRQSTASLHTLNACRPHGWGKQRGALPWLLPLSCTHQTRPSAAQPKSLEHADDLFHKADLNQDGRLRLEELRNLLREASKEYSHLEEHSRFLDA